MSSSRSWIVAAFAATTAHHEDLVPEDVGLGPYETLYAAEKRRAAETRQRKIAPGGDADICLGPTPPPLLDLFDVGGCAGVPSRYAWVLTGTAAIGLAARAAG